MLASPVWDYFAGGAKPLRIFVEEEKTRTASHLGVVKTGGNYAAALGPTLEARKQYGIDQVLFSPGGPVQATGAATFLLLRPGHAGEAALSGTAAVLAGVGTLVTRSGEHRVGSGEIGPVTQQLRQQLVAIQTGEAADQRGWLERV